ncbi:hypothetical protein OEZ85_001933 [Tetradesmus obliquus]|uniref:Uncharacterized protein n=1 Tax=Tetradesmus obliquus TaxID=3088 RepID=A0ABY8U1D6_TETOB|nr:hypothetical protein OEZ85_001933 [Tetradesmus obliquus]
MSLGLLSSKLAGLLPMRSGNLAAVASALKGAIWDVKDGALLSPDAWQALGKSASALLSAGSSLSYIGPVFALFGYAIKQWSTCQKVPQEAVDLLQGCKDLLFDLNQAWPDITPQALLLQQQQQQQQQQRLQRWLQLVSEAAAQCVVFNKKGPLVRFALAHEHKDALVSQADVLRELRQQLITVQQLALAGKADALNERGQG